MLPKSVRGGLAALVALAGVVAGAGFASANGVAMGVDVANSQQTIVDSASGQCTWRVGSSVTIINLTAEAQTLDSVNYNVSWTSPNASGVQTSVTALNNGGLAPGVTLAPDERRTFAPVDLQFAIPCDADFGDLAIRVRSAAGTGSGDAPFLEGGTPVPPGAIGLCILALFLGMQLIATHRRRSARPLPLEVQK